MIEGILVGVAKAIYKEFNIVPEYKTVKQGLMLPAFFVRLIDNADTAMISEQNLSRVNLDVSYVPVDGTSDVELQRTAWRLRHTLDGITINGTFKKPITFTTQVTDGVLHALLSFDIHWAIRRSVEPVETLVIDQGIKEVADGSEEKVQERQDPS